MKTKDYGVFLDMKSGWLAFCDASQRILLASIQVQRGVWDCRVECDDDRKPTAMVIQCGVGGLSPSERDWHPCPALDGLPALADRNVNLMLCPGRESCPRDKEWKPDSGPVRFAGTDREPHIGVQTAFWLASKTSFSKIEVAGFRKFCGRPDGPNDILDGMHPDSYEITAVRVVF